MKVNRLKPYGVLVIYAIEYIWEPSHDWYISLTIERSKKQRWGFGYQYSYGTHSINFMWWTYELYYDKP